MNYKQIGLSLLTGVIFGLTVFIITKIIILSVIAGGVLMGTMIRLEIENKN